MGGVKKYNLSSVFCLQVQITASNSESIQSEIVQIVQRHILTSMIYYTRGWGKRETIQNNIKKLIGKTLLWPKKQIFIIRNTKIPLSFSKLDHNNSFFETPPAESVCFATEIWPKSPQDNRVVRGNRDDDAVLFEKRLNFASTGGVQRVSFTCSLLRSVCLRV